MEKKKLDRCREINFEWKILSDEVMEYIGSEEEEKKFRWKSLEKNINDELIREYVKRIKDFDEVEDEEKEFEFVREVEDEKNEIYLLIKYK